MRFKPQLVETQMKDAYDEIVTLDELVPQDPDEQEGHEIDPATYRCRRCGRGLDSLLDAGSARCDGVPF